MRICAIYDYYEYEPEDVSSYLLHIEINHILNLISCTIFLFTIRLVLWASFVYTKSCH